MKVQIELKSKNVGTAKAEIDLINEIFEKTKPSASEDQKRLSKNFKEPSKKQKMKWI